MIWYRVQGQQSATRLLLPRLHHAHASRQSAPGRPKESKLAAVREAEMTQNTLEDRGGLVAMAKVATKPDKRGL